MGTAARLGGYVATLALVFGAAWWAGTVTGPPDDLASPAAASDAHAENRDTAATFEIDSAGLVSAAAGYTLVPRGPATFARGVAAELTFVVIGPGGRPVTAFDTKDERLMDLVVVRRDGAGFQRLQPTIGPGGVWRARLTLPDAGVYRVYADFVPTGGPALVLGIDLFVPGNFAPTEFPVSRTAQVAGYTVRLDADLVAGTTSHVFVTIDRNRLPVTDLEPYLGALCDLVVVRQSDLAYLRVGPEAPEAPGAPAHRTGPGLGFTVDVPAAGGHRLFVQFRHDGVVHTAEFTVRTGSDQ